MANRIFLVRHGIAESENGSLTQEGKGFHAVSAGLKLVGKKVGRGALILSSSAVPAVETAVVIQEQLDQSVLAQSELINEHRNSAAKIQNLDHLLVQAALQASVEIPINSDLIVVTHAPMIARACNARPEEIPFGHVVQYPPYSWPSN